MSDLSADEERRKESEEWPGTRENSSVVVQRFYVSMVKFCLNLFGCWLACLLNDKKGVLMLLL